MVAFESAGIAYRNRYELTETFFILNYFNDLWKVSLSIEEGTRERRQIQTHQHYSKI